MKQAIELWKAKEEMEPVPIFGTKTESQKNVRTYVDALYVLNFLLM